ncbi:MAG: sugar ABC transporter ATP-binding protein [Oscillospiraceae bacterium]|nr:sugar ABC transporter ATP-binding protein [Oscillospiraceae bacterium]
MLCLEHVSKSYRNVDALRDFTHTFESGKIYSIIGGNGAGKSTLINLICGSIRPTSGIIRLNDTEINWDGCSEASKHGIYVCNQSPNLFPNLSITENIFLGNEIHYKNGFLNHKEMTRQTQRMLDEFGLTLSPAQTAHRLSLSEKHIIQFLRALIMKPQIIILDELTDGITFNEAVLIKKKLCEFRDNGSTVILATHRVSESWDISDYVIVLKDGALFNCIDTRTKDMSNIQEFIMSPGSSQKKRYPKLHTAGRNVLLKVSNISNQMINDISFELHKGEAIGITGLAGSGRSSLLRAIIGLDKVSGGTVELMGKPIKLGKGIHPAIAYLPENPDKYGLFPHMSTVQNMTIRNLDIAKKGGVLFPSEERVVCNQLIDTLGIKTSGSIYDPVIYLSDGNKQKVLVARNLFSKCSVFVFDEPTKGVDVAGKVEIYNILNELLRKGAGVILVSSDLSELTGMCDRLLLIRKGSVYSQTSTDNLTVENMLSMFSQ